MEKSKEKDTEVLRYMLTHATLGAFLFCLFRSKLIVRHSGETCKTDFNDKVKVLRTADDLLRRGVVLCALCRGLLTLHGAYRRKVRDEESNQDCGWVAQGHCSVCKVFPALIPDFIMPHKHYSADVIERVIVESEDGRFIEHLGGCAADVSTMRRWVRQFRERGARAVGWLLSMLLAMYERQISLLELQNMTLLKQLARLLREYQIPQNGRVIGNANIILTTQNCGFL